MPCTFDINPEERRCEYCVVRNCDSREPKEPETYATTQAWLVKEKEVEEFKRAPRDTAEALLFGELMQACVELAPDEYWDARKFPFIYMPLACVKTSFLHRLREELRDRWKQKRHTKCTTPSGYGI